MAASGLAFAVLNAIMKEARVELLAAEVMAWRAISSLPPSALLALRPGFRVRNVRGMVIRALLGSISMVSTIAALASLSLAEMSLVGKLQPLLVAVAAPLVLGAEERIGRRDWALLLLGLCGSILLLGPTLWSGETAALWAVVSVIFSAGAHLAVRQLGASEDPATVVFWFQSVATCLALTILALDPDAGFRAPPAGLGPALLLSGLFATAGQWLMTAAYVRERAAVAAAASYTSPLWAAALDWWLWDVVPGPTALGGGTLILLAGGMLVFRAGDREEGAAGASQERTGSGATAPSEPSLPAR